MDCGADRVTGRCPHRTLRKRAARREALHGTGKNQVPHPAQSRKHRARSRCGQPSCERRFLGCRRNPKRRRRYPRLTAARSIGRGRAGGGCRAFVLLRGPTGCAVVRRQLRTMPWGQRRRYGSRLTARPCRLHLRTSCRHSVHARRARRCVPAPLVLLQDAAATRASGRRDRYHHSLCPRAAEGQRDRLRLSRCDGA